MKAHNFPQIYKELGIDLSKLGCVMLDLEPLENSYSIELDGAGIALYYAKNKTRFWIDGWVFDRPHLTWLYGLLTPANESPMRELVPMALDGWVYPEIDIEDIGFFDSPYEDEPYWCIVAHIKITSELQEGHERLCMLPHIKTFPGYKAHVTICYLNKEQGETYRNNMVDNFKRIWVVFSQYIRKRDNFTCFTCGQKGEGQGMHAGHFVAKSVGGMALYFHEENVHAQCYRCNIHLSGNQYEYAKRLGMEKAEELYALKHTIVKWTEHDYETKIKEYKEKLETL